MLLSNDFVIDAPVEQAWALLTDLERVAGCLPGAALEGRQGEDYLGAVKVKVGPISAHFRGKARFIEQDGDTHRAVISASGKDPKGQATANATITAHLEPESPTRTRVVVDTDLQISGRMAQFGRGAIADVSVRLLNQFSDNLSQQISADAAAGPLAEDKSVPLASPASATSSTPAAPAAPASSSAGGGLDGLSLFGPVVLQRLRPALPAVAVGFAVGWSMRGREERRRNWQLDRFRR
jgi:carbon monoxide dehydrogenase subunit G